MKKRSVLLTALFVLFVLKIFAGTTIETKPVETSSSSIIIIVVVVLVSLATGIVFGITIGKRKRH
jgi:uncharacterized membrane protein AbrB (regulator of aidB expression)